MFRSLCSTWRSMCNVGSAAQCRSSSTSSVGAIVRLRLEPARDRFEQQVALGFGIARRRSQPRQALLELGHEPTELTRGRAEQRRELVGRRVRDDVRERFHERLERHAEPVVAAAEEHEVAFEVDRACELGREARLADAGLARHQHRAPRTGDRVLPRERHLLELVVAPGEREPRRDRERAWERQLDVAHDERRPLDLARGDRIGKPFQLQLADGSDRHLGATAEQHAHDVGDQHLSAARGRTQP